MGEEWQLTDRLKLDKPCTACELIIHPSPCHPDPHHSSQCHLPQEAEGTEETGQCRLDKFDISYAKCDKDKKVCVASNNRNMVNYICAIKIGKYIIEYL